MSRTKAVFVVLIFIMFASLSLSRALFIDVPTVSAQTGGTTPTGTPAVEPVNPHGDTSQCLSCHSNPNMMGRFPDGTLISLYVDTSTHAETRHLMRCAACHEDEQTYPHENSRQTACNICHWQVTGQSEPSQMIFTLSYPDERAISLNVAEACKKCHKEKYDEMADSVHLKIMAEGNRFAPVCVDCHNSHDIVPGLLSRDLVAKVCSKCHFAVYTSYESSVHGAALEEDGNPDVPTCGDCHGIHNVHGPSDIDFRADSIVICGNCHSDEKRMSKYGISTNVLSTYLEDFHGRTVDFFRKSNKPQITKATCYDCHGIHNIRSPEDAASAVYPTNLQSTCQQCHRDADITFPQAWLSHYAPTWDKTPVLYGVELFYKYLIPVVIGGFVVYILLDAIRRISHALKHRSAK